MRCFCTKHLIPEIWCGIDDDTGGIRFDFNASIKIESDTTCIIIDTTPDFRYQMLRTKTTHIDAVVFTHPHRDHYAGLDDIRPFNFFSGKSMPIYANTITQVAIKRDFYYAFEADKEAGLPEMQLLTIEPTASFKIGDIELMPIEVMHRDMPVLAQAYRDASPLLALIQYPQS